jgi:hypothetical protein
MTERPLIDMRFNEQDIPFEAPSLAGTARDDVSSKDAFVSAGQHAHKWGTYLSIDWIFNAMTGVTFAYWGKFTESGQKIWSGPISKAFEKGLSPFIKNPEHLKTSSEYGNIFMSIIAGGMFTIPPLLLLENKKVKRDTTEAIDRVVYGKETIENDPRFQASYEEIEKEPKKDFTRGLTSRFTALAPLLAMVLIPATRKISDKLWFDHVAGASEKVAAKMGYGPESFKSVPLAEGKERWNFIHRSVAMDFGLGVPYAVLHAFFYNKFVNGKNGKHPENGDAPHNGVEHPAMSAALPAPQNSEAKDAPQTHLGEVRSVAHSSQHQHVGAQA